MLRSLSSKERYNKLISTLGQDDALAIIINPDPDAIGSACALKRLLWGHVKRVGVYRVAQIQRPDNATMVRLLRIQLRPLRELKPSQYSKYALVDNQPSHHEGFSGRHYSLIIDHHPRLPETEADFLDIRENYGACCSILYEYLKIARIRPSKRLATALFFGIKTDTKDLLAAGNERDLAAFRDLTARVDKNVLKKIESSELTKATLMNFKKALDKMKFFKDTAFVYMDRVKSADDLVIIADFFVRVVDVNWAIVAGAHNDKVVVIFRYFGYRSDAGKKAKALFEPLHGSAGGHRSAARAEIDLEKVSQYLGPKMPIEKFLQHLVKYGKPPRD